MIRIAHQAPLSVALALLLIARAGALAVQNPKAAEAAAAAGTPMLTLSSMVPKAAAAAANTTNGLVLYSVQLAWDKSPDSSVVGYNVYYGTSSRTYTVLVSAGTNLTIPIRNLVDDGTRYFFAATAYNVLGMESDFSAECSYVLSPPVPPTVAMLVSWPGTNLMQLLTSADGRKWTPLTNSRSPVTIGGAWFVRTRGNSAVRLTVTGIK